LAGITVEHLSKTYGKLVALSDVSLEVRPGEVLGLLGGSLALVAVLLVTVALVYTYAILTTLLNIAGDWIVRREDL
jgi:ABC-type phosphonate transport system ATPase subunit